MIQRNTQGYLLLYKKVVQEETEKWKRIERKVEFLGCCPVELSITRGLLVNTRSNSVRFNCACLHKFFFFS